MEEMEYFVLRCSVVREREVLEKQMEESDNDYQDQWDKRWCSFWTRHVVMEEQAERAVCPTVPISAGNSH